MRVNDADHAALKTHFARLSMLEERHFGFHTSILRSFFEWAAHQNLRVAMVQGHYHPRALEQNCELSIRAGKALSALANEFSNVRYIPAERLLELSVDDYRARWLPRAA